VRNGSFLSVGRRRLLQSQMCWLKKARPARQLQECETHFCKQFW